MDDSFSDSAVSIHSIVTDKDDFQSDNEAPEDKPGQEDKIIQNHVVKKIIEPGKGLSKPSKNDFVIIHYKCYFPNNEIISDFYEHTQLKQYMYKIKLPKGIQKAIFNMRLEEKSTIILQPKYGFRKVTKEDYHKYIENINFDDDVLINKMKTSPIIYEVALINFIHIYDITGERNIMKYIINQGEGLMKPADGNEVIINFKFFEDSKLIIEKCNLTFALSADNIDPSEIAIIKSFKKNEKSNVEISSQIIDNLKNNKNSLLNRFDIVDKLLFDNEKHRHQYEVELVKFKQNNRIITLKNINYQSRRLTKGLGNVCPWKNSLIMLSIHLQINDNLVYSDFGDYDEYLNNIRHIKKKIKLIKSYEKNLQFIVEDELNKLAIKGNIFDPFSQNFPLIVFKEIVPTLKLLETVQITFQSSLPYLKLNDLEIIKDDEVKNYKLTLCLLNFEERATIFNKSAYSEVEINENIKKYKSLANYYFGLNLLVQAKRVNKYLVDEYIKLVNLEGTPSLSQNKKDFEPKNISIINLNNQLFAEMKKITSNLILIYYKKQKYKKCNEYINHYFLIFDKDQLEEKVLYYKYKVLSEGYNMYDESKHFLEKIINTHCNSVNLKNYEADLHNLNKIIELNKERKNKFIKKMFKFD